MRLIIVGAGGYGRTVADVAAQTGHFDEILFLDDHSQEKDVLGCCRDFTDYIDENTEFYPAFGVNCRRLAWIWRLEDEGARVASIIHPSAYISPTASLEIGIAVLPKAAVNTNCRIRNGAIINLGALVDHDCVIGEGSHICVGAIVKGENRIPDQMKLEAGQVIENRTYPL